MNETAILQDIASKTQSELILFFVIIVVILVVFLLPLYRMISREKKEKLEYENTRQDKYLEREKEIIKVISENSQVIAELKTMLKENSVTTNNALVRIHERIDDQNKSIVNLGTQIAKIESTLERSISNQTAMADSLNKTLLIVDNLPNNSNFSIKGRAEK